VGQQTIYVGLLPGSRVTCSTRVLTPVLYAQKSFWGLRHVSKKEVLLAKDLLEQTVEKLEGLEFNPSVLGLLLPGKCLMHGFETLFKRGIEKTTNSVTKAIGITHFADPTEDEDNCHTGKPQSKRT
jgi:hypothetical protein